jgi:hypothetical protein
MYETDTMSLTSEVQEDGGHHKPAPWEVAAGDSEGHSGMPGGRGQVFPACRALRPSFATVAFHSLRSQRGHDLQAQVDDVPGWLAFLVEEGEGA